MNEPTKQQLIKYKIDRSRLIKGSKRSMNVSEVIAISMIMQTRLSKPETIKFKSDLRSNQINLIVKKTISSNTLLKTFYTKKIKLQHKILENKRIRTDMYFSGHKLVVEIDKKRSYWQKSK